MSVAAMRDLRPLSIGELLDRAFSITIKNLVPFAAIVFVVIAPEIVLEYVMSQGPMSAFFQQIQQLSVPGAQATPPDPSKMLAVEAGLLPYFTYLGLYSLVVIPLANAAVVSGISRAYLGMPVRFADCYRAALGRWGWLILLGLLWVAAAVAAWIVALIPFFIVTIGLSALGAALGTFGVIVAIVIGIAAFLAMIAFVIMIYLAAAFSFVAAVLEMMPPGLAFRSGFQRVFGEGQLWRSLAIAASMFGIAIGFELVAMVIGAVVAMTHVLALTFVVNGIIGAFLYPFLFAVVAVCYYDVRIRREGFDLQLLASQLSAPSTAQAP